MEAYAIHKGAIIKPRLARMTMDLVRGKDVASARRILETTNTKARNLYFFAKKPLTNEKFRV